MGLFLYIIPLSKLPGSISQVFLNLFGSLTRPSQEITQDLDIVAFVQYQAGPWNVCVVFSNVLAARSLDTD